MGRQNETGGAGVKKQTIFRVQKEAGDFFIMHKGIVDDSVISYKAKGIMAYLLSKPDDWEIYFADIVKHSGDGKAAVQSGIHELESAGYIKRVQQKDKNGKYLPVEWHVYEQPFTANRFSVTGKPATGKPATGKSDTTNNNSTNNKESNNKNKPLTLYVETFGKVPETSGTYDGEELCQMLEEANDIVGYAEYEKVIEWSRGKTYEHPHSRIKAILTTARGWEPKPNGQTAAVSTKRTERGSVYG